MSDVFGVLAAQTERSLELSRRIGFAKGALESALELLEGRLEPDSRYWVEKDLRRALDELAGKTYGGNLRDRTELVEA